MPLLLSLVFALAGPAWADEELQPMVGGTPVLVVVQDGDEDVYFPLAGGGRLDFDSPGPTRLKIQVRRRLVSANDTPAPVSLDALGDGAKIMSIRVSKGPEKGASIFDARGGIPTAEDEARITVPKGGNIFTLMAPPGSGDFLIRVVQLGDANALAAASGAGDMGLAEKSLRPPDPLAPADHVAAPAMPDEPSPWDMPPSAAAPEVATGPEAAAEPSPVPEEARVDVPPPSELMSPMRTHTPTGSAVVSDQGQIGFAGPEIGFGAPARGDKAVVYVGARFRRPILVDMVDASAAAGWYRIGVNHEVPVDVGGQGEAESWFTWHTNVVPIMADGVYHIPLDLQIGDTDIDPIAGAGLGLYLGFRSDDLDSVFGAVVGVQTFAGADVPVGPGSITTLISWNGARRHFGSTGEDGEPVRETLATVRLNASYLVPF